MTTNLTVQRLLSPERQRDRWRPKPAGLRVGLLRRRWGLPESAARTVAALAFGEE